MQADLFYSPPPEPKKWNSRYVAYAAAHGRGPEEMLLYDRKRCPGGYLGEFAAWMNKYWREWEKITGSTPYRHTQADHDNFDAWLTKEK